ncbi:MAG: sigma-70 family RNA polymerase sigma factor [Chitinophaga sp.]|uniref:RNA polymerase sigma factor n=1 Tax=Chitinophaga sp. TaxID=1869181 RepID=UPI0025BB68AC|nr:sigma-70 family RNA polymerase sigma factor [Chitinophaga sp.]MBV8255240.1 sigma-70 family RNA polymerase sigma factor [Chitinophaga sp.]
MVSIDDIIQGSEVAFSLAFDEFQCKLYGYFLKKTKSEEMSKELVQLTFIKLWRFRHTLSSELSVDIQIFRIAASCLIDFLRQQNTLKIKETTPLKHIDTFPELLVEDSSKSLENADYIHSVMRTLSPVRQKVFVLRHIYGYSYKEIATELSISVKTVEDHISKAQKHIVSIAK